MVGGEGCMDQHAGTDGGENCECCVPGGGAERGSSSKTLMQDLV